MNVCQALKELQRALQTLSIPASRVEIWMPADDADRVRKALRPDWKPTGANGVCQVEGFLLYGSRDVPDHKGQLGEFAE